MFGLMRSALSFSSAPAVPIKNPYPLNFTPTTASSSGAYTLSFPQTVTLTAQIGGVGVYYTYTLSSNGVCTVNVGSNPTYTNSHYSLFANKEGYWNSTIYVNSALSATNDYREFGLPSNGADFAASGVAFVHTGHADCEVTVENGFQQTVNSYLAGNGNTYLNSWGTVESDDQGYGAESAVAFHYTTTGVLNETATPVIVNSYAVSGPYGPELGSVTFTDPYSSSPYTDSSHIVTVGPGGSIHQFGYENGGTYTSTSGLDMSVGVSVGWGGFSVSPSVELVYTTTVSSSSQKEILCSFTDPSTTENAQFYFYADGSQVSNIEAVNLHIWYDDLCVSGSSGC